MNPNALHVDWRVCMPIIIVTITGLVAMMTDVLARKRIVTAFVAIIGLALALVNTASLWGKGLEPTFAMNPPIGYGMLAADNFALFLDLLILSVGLLTFWMSLGWLEDQGLMYAEYYVLMLFAIAGMMLMVQSLELITIFVALETFSIALYVLSAFARKKERSGEAGLKYLLLGAFSSAFFLYGIALVYGAMGTTNLLEIGHALPGGGSDGYLLTIGIGLIIVGLAFKVAAVPFHVWTPDVYEGAPTPVTAFMSVATKAAAFGAMARILLFAFPSQQAAWEPILVGLALATMIVGNTAALWQTNIKRLLAYSSIAHAGYLMIGIVSGDTAGILFYLFCYAVMNMGAFACVAYLGRAGQEYTNIDDFKGLARRHTGVAVAMSIFMFSLAGIPPAIGYYGKFLLFYNAVNAGHTGLVIVGVLTSVVSAYYYLRVVVAMWMAEPDQHVKPARLAPGLAFVILFCAVVSLLAGAAPSRMVEYARAAITSESPGVARLPSDKTVVAQVHGAR